MNQESKVLEDYNNNKVTENAGRTMWIGIFTMCVVIVLDFLFIWIAHIL